MKHALILVGAVVLTALAASLAQKEGEFMRTSPLPWLFGTPQGIPVTAPTGEFQTNPARGATPFASSAS